MKGARVFKLKILVKFGFLYSATRASSPTVEFAHNVLNIYNINTGFLSGGQRG